MSNTISEQDPIVLIKLQERLSVVESEVADIRNRNRRVESDKSWETSRVRLLSITGITYVTMVLVFLVLGSSRPFVDALVPTTGFSNNEMEKFTASPVFLLSRYLLPSFREANLNFSFIITGL